MSATKASSMSILMLILFVGVFVAAAGFAAAVGATDEDDAVKADLTKIEGTWGLVGLEVGGSSADPQKYGRDYRRVIQGNKITLHSGLRAAEGSFTLDPSKNPKWIDETIGSDKQFQGIYELRGDRLRLLFEPMGLERPTEFKTKVGATHSIETYERLIFPARGLLSGETPMPERIVGADIVVLGRVVGIEPQDVDVVHSSNSPSKLRYRIAVLKVHEVIHGQKSENDLRIGFVSPDQDQNADIPALPPNHFSSFTLGQDGLFFLKKHHQGRFYVNFVLFGGVIPRIAPDFTKNLELTRRLSKVLDFPLEALKAESATNRFLAATMIIHRNRLRWLKDGKAMEKGVDIEVSKLLMKTLAEAAEWEDVIQAISSGRYPPHPYRVFLQLGVTVTDGYDPPKNSPDFRDTLRYTQNWLQNHQDKYRIQRFTQPAEEKMDDAEEKKEVSRLNRYYPNGFHFVDTLRADGKILWITKEVVEGKVKSQRREIASLEDFKKAFRTANVNKEASIEVHIRLVQIEGATKRAEEVLSFLLAEGYKKAGAVSN